MDPDRLGTGGRRDDVAPRAGGVHNHAGVVLRSTAIGDPPPTSDAAHAHRGRRGVDLAAASAETADVATMDRGDVDLACPRLDQAGTYPIGADHPGHLRSLDRVDL